MKFSDERECVGSIFGLKCGRANKTDGSGWEMKKVFVCSTMPGVVNCLFIGEEFLITYRRLFWDIFADADCILGEVFRKASNRRSEDEKHPIYDLCA